MPIIDRDKLISELGGPRAAAQLLPDETTGDIDFVKLDGAIANAIGDCQASLGARWEAMDDLPTLKMQRIGLQLGVYYAWAKNPTKAIPETVRSQYGSARLDLEKIENAQSKPGPDTRQRFPYGVDNSDGGRRAVHCTMRHAGILGRR